MFYYFLYEISQDSLWIWIWTHLFVIWNHVDIEESCQTSDLGLLKEIFVLQLGANPSCHESVDALQPGGIFKKKHHVSPCCIFVSSVTLEVLSLLFSFFFHLLLHLPPLSPSPGPISVRLQASVAWTLTRSQQLIVESFTHKLHLLVQEIV